ncbi:hypothetical protein MAPG_09018 [Magnaporthiopsis poae ATCC 64411]|uniref:Nephrocystin 3-like N-terminal domain-containing protein n=1 Tax=Magnaporthiopsis poae (strain ATCC 64411 / 73-15) TaxID=644358 RepID=A0A0C4E8U9_MAGP6|nr:hypothetical protein MAPG_09018 [Magnaporthiopsis poae ATCC 64411]
MEQQQPHPIPAGRQLPPSVNFIQTTLPRKLDVLRGAHVYYNPQSNQFEPVKTTAAAMPPSSIGGKARPEVTRERNIEPPVRELVPAVEAMVFWNAILEPAMRRFSTQNQPEPGALVEKPQYSIRAKKEWRSIHENLQSAQDVFNAAGKPVLSRLKHIYRKVADHAETLQEVIAAAPDEGAYVSLVKSVLGLLLGALGASAKVRMKVTGFADEEDMKKGFSKVEIFLAAFPGDPNIKEASVDLIACILKAVERAILYFLSGTFSRVGGIGKQDLIDSIEKIPERTKELMGRVEESHIWGLQKASGLTLANIEELRLLNVENAMAISLKTDKIFSQGREIMLRLDSVGGIVHEHMQQFTQQQEVRDANFKAELQANIMNGVKILFDDYAENIKESLRQEIEVSVRSHSSAATSRNPSPGPEQQQQSPPQWPPQNTYGPPPPPWPQDPYAAYYQHHQQQQQFYPQNPSYLTSPPPVYAHPQYYQQLLPVPPPPPVPEPTTIPVTALLSALGSFCGLDKRDVQTALSQSESIPIPYRLRAQEIIQAREFRAWATAPSSRELLILGDPSLEHVQAGAAVSLVTASLTESLRARGAGFATLAFFCGLHTRRDDAHVGAAATIRALIAQLLEQHYVGYRFQQGDLGLSLEQLAGSTDSTTTAADLAALCALFEWLVKWLPRDKTLVVVVDGIGEYEATQFKEGMLVVLRCLLGLVAASEAKKQGPVVKVLATCPTGTISLRSEFRSNGPESILVMEALEVVNERMDMELSLPWR